MKPHRLIIRNDGRMEWLNPPPFQLPAKTTRKRYSEITPTNPFLFFAFRLLRLTFGEVGAVSQWTRGWRCEWRMTVLRTGFTMTSWNREELIELEHELFFSERHKPLGEL